MSSAKIVFIINDRFPLGVYESGNSDACKAHRLFVSLNSRLERNKEDEKNSDASSTTASVKRDPSSVKLHAFYKN